ncbi:hypothetical protein HY025_00070 [Candidatus Daviesbacteria bacterium]|nr:hypothetical protein [Candidatus Daviesbacteria bacterium]
MILLNSFTLLPIFLILIFFVIYTTGFLILKLGKVELVAEECIALSLMLGSVIFVFEAILFGLLNLRFLSLPMLIILNIYIFIRYKFEILKTWKVFLYNWKLLSIILVGILIQGFINFPSGINYGDGLLFWSSQGHDGLWHISLMQEIVKSMPPKNPIYAHEVLYNYHYLVDIFMGEFARIFPIFSLLDLYFRFFPVVLSFMIGVSVFSFVSLWKKNALIGLIATAFTYFIGSFGFVVTYMKHGIIFGGETVFWAAQPNTILGNPPHAIAFSFITAYFLSFLKYFRERNKFWLIIAFLLGGVLTGFKVSGGIVLVFGVLAAGLFDLINTKKLTTLFFAILISITNFITFKLLTKSGEGHLIFLPWWFIRTMVVAGNRLDWLDLELRRQTYLAAGTWHSYLRVLQLETLAFLIFLIGNTGMRIIALYEFIRIFGKKGSLLLKDPFEISLLTTMLVAFLIPIFFVQQGIIYNNIQFMQYYLLIMGFYAAVVFYKVIHIKNALLKIFLIVLIIILSVPTVIGNLVEFYGPGTTALAIVSNAQLQSLDYLKNNTPSDATILSYPFDKYLKDKYQQQPRPIYAWYSTSYISAFGLRSTYLSAEEQALITGYPLNDRLEKMNKFFSQVDFKWNEEFLADEKIDYIYLEKPQIKNQLDLEKNHLVKIFENNESIIYKVKKI